MATLKELYELTLNIVTDLQSISYEKLEQLVELREEVLSALSQSSVTITDEDKSYIHAIGTYDIQIVGRMVALRDEASEGLTKLENKRKQRSSYDAQYEGGSYFIDMKN